MQFSERITGSYPEIFERGVTEGHAAESYFKDWGWYPSIKMLAKDNIQEIENVLKLNVHECLYFLCCEAVENKVKIEAMKRTNASPNDKVTHL